MARKVPRIAVTDSVRKAQERFFGRSQRVGENYRFRRSPNDEVSFIQARDSFYMATISENGWPYIQHRGGAPGFLRARFTRLAFAITKETGRCSRRAI